MEFITRAYPVYEENTDTAKFFVSPVLAAPLAVEYSKGDPFGRKGHHSQFLTVPVDIPNYFALCQVPGQRPWGVMDELDVSAMRVNALMVSFEVEGKIYHAHVATTAMPTSTFIKAPEGSSVLLDMRMLKVSGLNTETWCGKNIGEEVFVGFKALGYDPLLSVSVVASFDRQRCSLITKCLAGKLTALRNIVTGNVIPVEELDDVFNGALLNDLRGLVNSVGKATVTGIRIAQELR